MGDHSMARSIVDSLSSDSVSDTRAPLVLHICGAFHCAHGLGIPEVLPLYGPDGPNAPNATRAKSDDADCWLPMDDILSSDKGTGSSEEFIGPKPCPEGVTSVVCWP